MVFQLNAQIPIAYRGYDYGRSQQNALRGMQMDAAEREIGEQNALAAVFREGGAGLASDDPAQRAAAAARLAAVGPRGYALAAPVLQRARDESAVSRIFGGGGGAAAPAAPAAGGAIPAVAAPTGEGGGFSPAGMTILTGAESSGNRFARPRNPDGSLRSSAVGPQQFIEGTWLAFARANPDAFPNINLATPEGRQTALAARTDPNMSARATQWYARQNAAALQAAGIPVNDATLALAHQFDGPVAARLLSAPPNTPVEQVVGPAAVAANPAQLRGKTAGDVVASFARRYGGGAAPAPAGGDVIPASAQGGGGGPQRMPGQPTQAQFAQLMQQAATGNEVAQRLVQNWLPFMRQENPNFQLTEIDGQRVAIDPRNPNNRVVLGRAGASGDGMTPARAQQILPALAPRIASGQASEQEVREYLSAAQVASFRVAENGTLVRTPLPAFAPPPEAVLQMYPGIAFQMPAPGAPAGAAPSAAPAPGAPQAPPMAAPQAAPQTPAAAGDAAPATVQLPPPPGTTMPGPGGGVSRPPGPGGTVANQIEERQFNAAEQIARLSAIRRDFRPEHQTFAARLSNRWTALREFGGRQLSPDERQRLTEYTQSRARSLENLNYTIQAVTGAAMGIDEADRIIATMPNPGTGLFDGDSPTEFQAKLDRATQDVQNAIIRYSLARQRGVDPLRSGIRLEDVPGLVNQRGEEIAREIRADNPRLSENAVRQQVDARLGAELGLR
jgi:hypothetical protein